MRFAAERQLQLDEILKLEAAAKAKAKEAGEKFESEVWRQNVNADYIKLLACDRYRSDPTAVDAGSYRSILAKNRLRS